MRLFFNDVSRIYSQSKDKLTRKSFMQPKKRNLMYFGLQEDELFELIRPFWGLCNAEDYWGKTIKGTLRNDFGMRSLYTDFGLFVIIGKNCSIGICNAHVVDCFNARFKKFRTLFKSTLQNFDTITRVYDDVGFFEAHTRTSTNDTFAISQEFYIKNMTYVPLDLCLDGFRRFCALFSWMIDTRLDVACFASRVAQATERTFGKDKVWELNQAIKIIMKNIFAGFKYQKLDRESLQVWVYADASYATNADFSCQVEYLILLCDINNICHVLDFHSTKVRVVRSIMAGKASAFMVTFDTAFLIM